MRHLMLSALVATSLATVSCSSDDDSNVIDQPSEINVPSTYSFSRGGVSTVSFSGQTTRILMSEEIVSSFSDFDNATEASIDAMFAHEEGANDFSSEDLNASNKSVRSKVAASRDFFSTNTTESAEIKADFDGFIADQVNIVFPNQNTAAQPGVAGQIADGTSTRYVNESGIELNQYFAKGLIGALMTDQILNNYLSTAVLDEADNRDTNDNDITEEGSAYTTMEHKWDEAYGYLFGASATADNPVATIGDADSFLNKYVGRVEGDADFAGTTQTIFDAFKLGRAAIVAKDYEVRDAQAEIIRTEISKVIGIRAVYYLQQGSVAITNNDMGAAFHDLSEGIGFVYSLQFTRQPGTNAQLFTRAEVQALIANLLDDGENGLWNITPESLQEVSEAIASKFSFTVAQAGSAQ
ncbi:DUF4856 domain-containing protein [Croceibacter atlanticus]|jgi:hypothetical protein|uniref:DUF4856 domain-containing protein n=1 Tax=Croceibacter atlanticus (strain ATCC BAA-628 / JCM 21780 / CIP 108009 / IAM 15332 / KCTC 12090 / HTCC2559) TaxID=216432 RepID=A3UBR2_CROAH|nr:DUF4856 domain-containing protein [Croceibacter atlanticus]EAP86063.1 hypothetical protein CA2559_08521 [Croceibacter atlanticus HTCC2559]